MTILKRERNPEGFTGNQHGFTGSFRRVVNPRTLCHFKQNKDGKIQEAACACQAKKWASGTITSPMDPSKTLEIKKEYIDNLIVDWNYDIGMKELSIIGRNTQGVRLMNISTLEHIVGMQRLEDLGESPIKEVE